MFKGRYLILTVFALVALVLAGCTGGTGEGGTSTGSLEGYVYISDGGQFSASSNQVSGDYSPLADAKVQLIDTNGGLRSEQTTNGQGFFRFDTVNEGYWRLRVSDTRLLEDHEQVIRIRRDQTTYLDYGDTIKTGIGYYLIVGVSDYQYMPNYVAGRKNAELIHSVFNPVVSEHNMDSRVVQLLDSQATYSRIRTEIERAMDMLQPEDYFVFYFSGHGGGGLVGDPDYLIPYDGDDITGENAITDGLLRDWIITDIASDPFAGTHVTVILDFDYSGYFMDDFATYRGDFGASALRNHDRTTVLTSGNEVSPYIPSFEATVFTHFLAQGLSSPFAADSNNDGVIKSGELFAYVNSRMDQFFRQNGSIERAMPLEPTDANTRILRYR